MEEALGFPVKSLIVLPFLLLLTLPTISIILVSSSLLSQQNSERLRTAITKELGTV